MKIELVNSLQLMANKEVTVLCSGKSVDFHLDSSKIAIVPNRSILLPQVEKYETVVWVKGTGWQRENVVSWWKELAIEVARAPDYILTRYEPGMDDRYFKFENEFSRIFPNTKILPTSLSRNTNGILSTGMRCVQLALDSFASKIVVAGMEMGHNTKYSDLLMKNNVISQKGDDSFTRHLKSDIEFYKNLNTSQFSKIFPIENSGFSKLLREGKIR